MATRAYVGIKTQEGSIRYIYNHYDGYVSGLGKVLYENYNTKEKVICLLANGHASSIGETLNSSTFYADDDEIGNYESYGFKDPAIVDYHYLFEAGEWYYRASNETEFKRLSDEF